MITGRGREEIKKKGTNGERTQGRIKGRKDTQEEQNERRKQQGGEEKYKERRKGHKTEKTNVRKEAKK